MKCLICGEPGKELELSGGAKVGAYCAGECTALGLEKSLLESTGMLSGYEAKLLNWRWRRRQAEVHGKPFGAPPPKSASEVVAEAQTITATLGGMR